MSYSVILKALVETLGGDGEEFDKELDDLLNKYPNCMLLLADLLRNGSVLSKEVEEQYHKIEILKNCLVESKLLIQVPAPDNADEMTRAEVQEHINNYMSASQNSEDEVKINDIVWHMACDEDIIN